MLYWFYETSRHRFFKFLNADQLTKVPIFNLPPCLKDPWMSYGNFSREWMHHESRWNRLLSYIYHTSHKSIYRKFLWINEPWKDAPAIWNKVYLKTWVKDPMLDSHESTVKLNLQLGKLMRRKEAWDASFSVTKV